MYMKINKVSIFVFISLMGHALGVSVQSQEANNMAAQMSACNANKSTSWDSSKNRCVTKKADQTTRFQTEACAKIEDVKQREACHLKIAEDKTGLSGNADSLYQGNYTKSMIMNAVPAAYAVTFFINTEASGVTGVPAPTTGDVPKTADLDNKPTTAAADKKVDAKEDKTKSKCMSKAILATTGVVGLATDFYMKSQAKKKMQEIKKSYSLETESTAFEAQKTAFDYLKKEQETVVEIAGMEKKRNAALILGYGAAMAMAIYEQFQNNPACKVSTGG